MTAPLLQNIGAVFLGILSCAAYSRGIPSKMLLPALRRAVTQDTQHGIPVLGHIYTAV